LEKTVRQGGNFSGWLKFGPVAPLPECCCKS